MNIVLYRFSTILFRIKQILRWSLGSSCHAEHKLLCAEVQYVVSVTFYLTTKYLLKQCAAVINHLLWMSVAPHRWSLWYWRLPIQGHSPLRAVTPPTILCDPNAGRTPQSATKTHIRSISFQTKYVYTFTHVNIPQFISSARLGQSWTPSHSGLILVMQEVVLHWKFPLQFKTGRHDGEIM